MWISHDPHAQSYNTLLSGESQRMVAKLGWGPAHQQPACLACHAPEGAAPLTVSHRSSATDGVGCESCHGAAEHWLAAHKTDDWAFSTAAQKAALGFRNLDHLAVRSENCASCHLGSPGKPGSPVKPGSPGKLGSLRREVNHDLIAAGHPRLMYEMSSLHARLPKHWRDESQPKATLDARLWAVGRVAAAEGSLALLESRASDSHQSGEQRAWPEFSEYDCYACHHDLAEPSWRQDSERLATDGVAPGGMRWGGWNLALLPHAVGSQPIAGDSRLAELKQEMSRPLPARQKIVTLARAARESLAGQAADLAARPISRDDLQRYLHKLSQPDATSHASWDLSAQRFLALAAVHYSSVAWQSLERSPEGSTAAHRRQSLVTLRDLLQFESDAEGPGYNSPRRWTLGRRQAISQQLKSIHQGAGQP